MFTHAYRLVVLYRIGHHAPEDVLPCCKETLQYLQVEYLDLYLIHVPFAIRKTAKFPNLTEEDKLYYSAEAISKTWAVSMTEFSKKKKNGSNIHIIGHGGSCEQGAGEGYWNL